MTKIIKRGTEEIESTDLAAPSAKVIDREVLSASDEARRIVEAARDQAERLRSSAQADHDAAVQKGFQEGYDSGLGKWLEECRRLGERAQAVLELSKPQVIRLALRVAEKIIRQKLEMSPEAVAPMVDEALRSLRTQSKIVIRVHPADVPILEPRRKRWIERNPTLSGIDIVGDEEFQRGGCRIETEFGMVDTTVETQIRVIEKHLLGDSAQGR